MSETLEEYVRKLGGGGVHRAYRLYVSGQLRIRDPSPPKDFLEYIMRPDYSLWYWILLATGILAVAVATLLPWATPLRLVLGAVMMFFLPGYVTIELLFPSDDSLHDLERLGLSVVTSFAVTSLAGLVLNLTPAGISIVSSSSAIMVYVLLTGIGALYRKWSHVKRPIA